MDRRFFEAKYSAGANHCASAGSCAPNSEAMFVADTVRMAVSVFVCVMLLLAGIVGILGSILVLLVSVLVILVSILILENSFPTPSKQIIRFRPACLP